MARPRKYPEELLDRGVRVVVESGRPIAHVARDLGVGAESLCKRVRQAEADSGKRSELLSTQEREEIRKSVARLTGLPERRHGLIALPMVETAEAGR